MLDALQFSSYSTRLWQQEQLEQANTVNRSLVILVILVNWLPLKLMEAADDILSAD